jgi:serine protease Do
MLKRILVAALILLAAVPAAAQEKRLPASRAEVELSFAPLVKRVAPAVVNIYSRRLVEEARSPLFDDPFFKQFFGDRFGMSLPRRQRQQNSLGSGVIVSPDGLVVTSHHVIEGADEITVALSDRREFQAELVLDDESTDLAVLRIPGQGRLPYLELRDSDEVEVGDLVLAIGNPFNVGQTVTSGIVSALARTGLGVTDYQFFIQTDAAINPGNSGGALVTMDGRLIGINTAIFSRSGGSHGIGFAIPSAMVRAVLDSARSGLDHVQRPWLGAATQPVTGEIAASLGLDRPVGALVRTVYPGGPAAEAGLRTGDVIVRVDGHEVDDPAALAFRLGTRRLGEQARVEFLRDSRRLSTSLKLVRAPEVPPRDLSALQGRNPLAGATVANLSPALNEELGLEAGARGVIVVKVERRSPAEQLRLKPGDRVLQLNGAAVETVARLKQLLQRSASDWSIVVQRGEQTFNLVVRT